MPKEIIHEEIRKKVKSICASHNSFSGSDQEANDAVKTSIRNEFNYNMGPIAITSTSKSYGRSTMRMFSVMMYDPNGKTMVI